MKNEKTTSLFTFSVRDIAEIAILIALAVVCDTFLKIPVQAGGGSINFSGAVLFVIALRHGWFKGFVSGGIVFGLITCLIDGYGFATYPLEYLIAFGSTGILGVFAGYIANNCTKSTKGTVLSYVFLTLSLALWLGVRFMCGSIDSVMLYKVTWSEAFVYNAGYIGFSYLIDFVLLCILLIPLAKLSRLYPTNYMKGHKEAANEVTEE